MAARTWLGSDPKWEPWRLRDTFKGAVPESWLVASHSFVLHGVVFFDNSTLRYRLSPNAAGKAAGITANSRTCGVCDPCRVRQLRSRRYAGSLSDEKLG